MGLLDFLLIGVGLSMDAAAVSVANVLGRARSTHRRNLLMAATFGVFQGIMPVLGFFAGSVFAVFIRRYAGLITFAVLGVIGGSMLKEGFSPSKKAASEQSLTAGLLLVQAFATSIDAFAVGVSFCAEGAAIFTAAPLIALTTFVCSLTACALGRRFGSLLGERAELLGGTILLFIGIKALF
ncbi:MAG: manganese efflux pump MntP family protein [Pygmaiobacter sp.]